MSASDRIERAAALLFEQHQRRQSFDALPAEIAPRNVDDAYAIQSALFRLRVHALGSLVGHKVALTSKVMQKMVEFDSPFAGPLHANIVHQSGATLRNGDYIHLGLECELAAKLGDDLPAANAPYSATQIAAAVSALMPAFELVDDRHADYTKIGSLILTLIADNAWNGGIVLGQPMTNWRALDLAAIRGTLEVNGTPTGEGRGSDVLGHPFEALAWLVNTLAQHGIGMKAGMVVMTGSMIATKFVQAPAVVNFSVEGLGQVSVTLE